jgi:hypothetical protein
MFLHLSISKDSRSTMVEPCLIILILGFESCHIQQVRKNCETNMPNISLYYFSQTFIYWEISDKLAYFKTHHFNT